MNADRIKEIQADTPYPESQSIQQALLKVMYKLFYRKKK